MFDFLKHATVRFLYSETPEQEYMRHKEECIREAKEIRENLTEGQIDKTLADTFPASDPPAWY